MQGHMIGVQVHTNQRMLHNAFAQQFRDASELAKMSSWEAFAEGYVVGVISPDVIEGQMLLRSVSRYLDADLAMVSAPDLIGFAKVQN